MTTEQIESMQFAGWLGIQYWHQLATMFLTDTPASQQRATDRRALMFESELRAKGLIE